MRLPFFASPPRGTIPRTWPEGRRPLADEARDAERRERYWSWNEATGPRPGPDSAPRVAAAPDGRAWHRLGDPLQADFEASHMRHSIGYNWDHYSAMGEILSLRSEGLPEATVLVADGTVVHARRRENAPLLPADLAAVRALAGTWGWAVLDPDLL
jgi:hypothetical protein